MPSDIQPGNTNHPIPMVRLRLVTLVLIIIALASCAPSMTPTKASPIAASPFPEGKKPTPSIPFNESGRPSPQQVVITPTISATPPRIAGERSKYQMGVSLDLATQTLSVYEKIKYINNALDTLTDLVLVIQANQHPDEFYLSELTWGDGTTIEDFNWVGHNIQINLLDPLPSGHKLDIALKYSLVLSSRLKFPNYTSRQTNLGDWYPFIPPFRSGSGWITHDPGEVGENLVYDISDYEVTIQLVNAGDGVSLAASAPAVITPDGYSYKIDSVRNFSWSVGQNYLKLDKKAGSIDITVFVLPEHEQAGEAALDAVEKALVYYSDTFFPYKNKFLSIVESEVPDGMEYDGLFFLGQEYFASYEGRSNSLLVSLSAHETAHQWWYALVGNDPALEPWLDEALSTYSELLFYEHTYPQDIDWWWDYRINSFKPEGNINSSIYDFKTFRPYVNAVYLRGALFMDDIRHQVGDQQFLELLNGYAYFRAFEIAQSDDFFKVLASITQINVDNLKSSYFK
jgi:hypothetical protein